MNPSDSQAAPIQIQGGLSRSSGKTADAVRLFEVGGVTACNTLAGRRSFAQACRRAGYTVSERTKYNEHSQQVFSVTRTA